MTTNAFAPAPTYTISGIGPYDVPFEYQDENEIGVLILVDDVQEAVDPADYSVIPSGPATSGTVFLTAAFAAAHDNETLVLERDTAVAQSWVGLGSTAAELESQLDEMARAIQENQIASASSLRVISNELRAYEPQDGCVPYWDNALGSFANGLNYSVLEAGISSATTASNRVDIALHAISGGKWRADVAALVADTDLTYTPDQTATVAEGDNIVTQAEGFGYSVAAETATDHNLITAGGVKLYVLPGSEGYNALAFGAAGDGVTDDSAAIQAALEHIGPNATLIIPPGTYTITSTPEIPLSSSATFLEIIAYGATFQITGAIAGLARERPASISTAYTKSRISVRGLTVSGDNTAGSCGFLSYTTYGLSLTDCVATQCDTGYLVVFGLMTSLERCFATNCASYGIRFASGGSQIDLGSGPEVALTGGTSNNSNSNGSIARACRVFALSGSLAHFKAEACEMEFTNCITEGAAADNCYEYDNLGSTVSKGITIREAHVECFPNNAIYKIHSSIGTVGGTFLIEGQDTVVTAGGWTGALIDVGSGNKATIKIVSNKTTYNVAKYVKGDNTNRLPHFIVDSMDPDNWLDVAYWDSGVLGNVTTLTPMFNGSNEAWDLSTFNYYKKTGYVLWETTHDITFDFSANPSKALKVTGMSTGAFLLDGHFGMRGAETGYTTLGTLVGRAAIFDENKNFVGYAPLYDNIT